MAKYVCSGAKLKCSMGSGESELSRTVKGFFMKKSIYDFSTMLLLVCLVRSSSPEIAEPTPNTCHENPIGFNTRNRGDVQQIIWKNEFSLHQAYKAKLQDEKRERPDIIYVKFSINEYGKVIFAQICHSTMNDFDFERCLIKNVKRWKFGKSLVPGQIYELTYPFVFSQQ